nr:unnamed protein product [Digitaria exilis]
MEASSFVFMQQQEMGARLSSPCVLGPPPRATAPLPPLSLSTPRRLKPLLLPRPATASSTPHMLRRLAHARARHRLIRRTPHALSTAAAPAPVPPTLTTPPAAPPLSAADLELLLRRGHYSASTHRFHSILPLLSHPSGQPLPFPTLPLRLAMRSAASALDAVFAPRAATFAYRGRHAAIRYLRSIPSASWFFRVAIPRQRFGPRHVRRLLDAISGKVDDPGFLEYLNELFVSEAVAFELGGCELGRGLPQESELTATLVNIFFDPVDRELMAVREEMLTIDIRDRVIAVLERDLEVKVDRLGSSIHSAVSEKIEFLGIEFQAVPPSVLHPPMSEKAKRARKKYLKMKAEKAQELKNARETRRKKLGLKILNHLFKRVRRGEEFEFDFQIENEVQQVFKDWAEETVAEYFRFLMPKRGQNMSEEEERIAEEEEEEEYEKRTVEDLTELKMRANAPIELVRKARRNMVVAIVQPCLRRHFQSAAPRAAAGSSEMSYRLGVSHRRSLEDGARTSKRMPHLSTTHLQRHLYRIRKDPGTIWVEHVKLVACPHARQKQRQAPREPAAASLNHGAAGRSAPAASRAPVGRRRQRLQQQQQQQIGTRVMAWWRARVVAPMRRAWLAVAAARARVRKGDLRVPGRAGDVEHAELGEGGRRHCRRRRDSAEAEETAVLEAAALARPTAAAHRGGAARLTRRRWQRQAWSSMSEDTMIIMACRPPPTKIARCADCQSMVRCL